MAQKQILQDHASSSRRAFLGTYALTAFLALVIEACGGNSTVKAASTTAVPASDIAASTSPSTTHSAAHTSTTAAPKASTSAAAATTATTGPVGDVVVGSTEMHVVFTYVADAASAKQGGGRGGLKNPYVAVWIEDEQGKDLRPISLFYQEREARYVAELRRFSKAESARTAAGGQELIATYSSATRQPGKYDVVWDGTTADGKPLPAGSYFLCIESAREHGPYSLIREAITLGGTATEVAFADQGELQGASAKFVKKA
jgi:hypothetical protein